MLILDGSKNLGGCSILGKKSGIADKGVRCWHMWWELGQKSELSVKDMMRILNWML